MDLFVPNDVEFIIDNFYKNNFTAYMVGGCVRDSILGLTPKDYDITTSALPDVTLSLFEKTVPTGLQHGTVTVILNNEHYEVTTFRTDGDYLDSRRPSSVEFVSNIKEDLSRRDFTINALAYNKKEGLVDYFNGVEDIQNKLIKCVGDPNKRFEEDALRMLRAIRFSCQLNFNIHDKTLEAIKTKKELITNISKERVRDELFKILISDNPSYGLQLLVDTGIMKLILPEIDMLVEYTPNCTNHNKDVFKHTLKVIDKTRNDLVLRLAALFHDIGKLNTMTFLENGHCYFPGHSEESALMTKKILKGLKVDNKTIGAVCSIINDHLVLNVSYMPTDGEIKRLINKVSKENIFKLYELQRADIKSLWDPIPFLNKVQYIEDRTNFILSNNHPLTIKDLAIDGKFIITRFNLKPSKLIGEILSHLLDLVLDDISLNNEASLIDLTSKYLNTNI